MKIKQIIKQLVILIVLAGFLTVMTPAFVGAETCPNGGDPNNDCSITGGQGGSGSGTSDNSDGCDYNGAILNGSTLCDKGSNDPAQKSAVWGILLLASNILTAGAGIAAVGGLIYGSILWSSAGGNPSQVQKARSIVTNVVIGIIAYAAMYSFLNFLIPGGIFT